MIAEPAAMDRIDAMTAFVAVASHHSFTGAARRLGVAPSAVTRLVAALEQHLAIRLLQRTTRSVTLTDAGTRYLERARRILDAIDEAERSAHAERLEPTGRFVVSAPVVFGRLEVAPLMAELLARHPTVTGHLMLADRNVDLIEEGIDAAVRIGELADSSLVAHKVGQTRRVLVAAPDYLRTSRRLRSLDDLDAHQTIHCTALSPAPEWRCEKDGVERRVALTPSFVTNSVDVAIGHAERGGGLTFALAYQVADQLRDGRLQIVLPRHERPAQPISVVYPSGRLLSANVRAFVDLAATRAWSFMGAQPTGAR